MDCSPYLDAPTRSHLQALHDKAERLRSTIWIMEANATFGIDPELRARWRELNAERGELLEEIDRLTRPVAAE